MTLEELDGGLPNGLHDAQIESMSQDYVSAEVKLKIRILVGLPGQPEPDRYRYRAADLVFQRVRFCSCEFPLAESSFLHPGVLWFSYERTKPDSLPSGLAEVLPHGIQLYSLFIREWYAHIHIATEGVGFSWRGSD